MLATAPRPRVSVDRTAPFLWYTLCVVPQSQARVCQRARELGIETYVPMSRTPPQLRKFGRQRVVAAEVRPIMPGYVFVSLPTCGPRFHLFQSTQEGQEGIHGALRLLSSPDGPTPVSEAVIQSIRLREQNGEFDSGRKSEASHRKWVKAVKWAKRGLKIQFCGDDCPFAGRFGKITHVGERTELIEIEFEIMGRVTSISAALDWIRRVR